MTVRRETHSKIHTPKTNEIYDKDLSLFTAGVNFIAKRIELNQWEKSAVDLCNLFPIEAYRPYRSIAEFVVECHICHKNPQEKLFHNFRFISLSSFFADRPFRR